MTTREQAGKALDASIELLAKSKEERCKMRVQGPFTAGLVYRGFNCSPEHQVAVQEAYNSLPALVRAAFEQTDMHIEAVGTSLDMMARTETEASDMPPFALGVTNYLDRIVMVAEFTVGPIPGDERGPNGEKGFALGQAAVHAALASTLAHEIGHVFDAVQSDAGSMGKGFIKALVDDLELAMKLKENDENHYRLLCVANNAPQPREAFAEAFAYSIGHGGEARGPFAECFPHCIEYVRGWFERNYNKFERAAA